MKKLFTLLLIAGSITCYAQPTISSAVIGDIGDEFSYTIVTTTDFDHGAEGENITWDFSGISTSGTTSEYTYITAEATGQAATFPGANAATDFGDGNYTFFKISPSEFTVYGVYAPPITISYSDPEELMVFPLNYGTTNEDDLYSEFFSGIDMIRSGSNEILADGYGTLILPSGTYTNVLRVKMQEDYSDVGVGLPVTIEYNFETYYWLKEGIKGPLFQYNYQEVIAGVPTVNESYTINNNLEVVAISDETNDINLKLFPNPVSDILNISAGSTAILNSAEIFDITGKSVIFKSLSGQTSSIAVNDLEPGLYIVKIATTEGVYTRTVTLQ